MTLSLQICLTAAVCLSICIAFMQAYADGWIDLDEGHCGLIILVGVVSLLTIFGSFLVWVWQ